MQKKKKKERKKSPVHTEKEREIQASLDYITHPASNKTKQQPQIILGLQM
jgi:hypothetical protein